MANVVVHGVPELVAKMHTLPDKIRKRGMRSAIAKAARPVVSATKSRAPVRTGLLRQSIASKVIKRRGGNYAALIGEKRLKITKRRKKAGFKVTKTVAKRMASMGVDNAEPARYAHLVEFGHRKRTRNVLVKLFRSLGFSGGGKVGARPFALPGLQAAAGASQSALQASLKQFIETEAGK